MESQEALRELGNFLDLRNIVKQGSIRELFLRNIKEVETKMSKEADLVMLSIIEPTLRSKEFIWVGLALRIYEHFFGGQGN